MTEDERTLELRLVVRDRKLPWAQMPQPILVLQQKWYLNIPGEYEWRDIPIINEATGEPVGEEA